MTVTALSAPEPAPQGIESWKYDFALEDDAHAFREGVREELDGEDENTFAYVDSEVWFDETGGKWWLRIDVVRLDIGRAVACDPEPPEAA